MEDQTQKILSLQEELIVLQKSSYNGSLEAAKKTYEHKTIIISLLAITLLSLAYAFVVSLLYFAG